jgi:hypothetical protein
VQGRGGPVVRAAFTQAALAAVDGLPGDVRKRVRESIPRDALARVTGAGRLEWIPVELDMAVTEAITSVLGPERSARFWKKSLLYTMETPLLEPILAGATNLFGLVPGSLLRWAPRVWEALYRDAGVMTVSEIGGSSALVSMSALAPALARSPAFVEAVRASLEALFAITRTAGEVRLVDVDLPAGRASFDVSWTRAAEG